MNLWNEVTIDNGVTVFYYLITLFFLVAILANFFKTKNKQDAALYGIMIIPFVLRLLLLK